MFAQEKTIETSPPKLSVQDLTIDHLVEVEAILRQNITVPQVLSVEEEINRAIKRMESSLNDPSGLPKYLVATNITGRVMGVMGLNTVNKKLTSKIEEPAETLEIINAYVDLDAAKHGAGGALLTNLMHIAVTLGCKQIAVVSGYRYEEAGHPFWTKYFGKPQKHENYYDDDIYANLWLFELPQNSTEISRVLPALGSIANGKQ